MLTSRARLSQTSCLLEVAALVLAVLGCGRKTTSMRGHGSAADSTSASTGFTNPAEVPHPCPAQPSGPQVGRSDPRLNAVSPRLAEWTAMWAQALPGFAPDSMWLVHRGRWNALARGKYQPMVIGKDADPGEDLAFELLGLRSPDRRYILDVDSYQVIEPSGDSLNVGGEPDSRCTLIDEPARLEFVLLECGTPCGYHWGTWLSNSSFAVGGWNDADDFGQWKQGGLSIYSIPDSSVTEYATRIVSAAAYARYEAAWGGWLLRRYRMLKHSRPPV
jgi:hypothetical protein